LKGGSGTNLEYRIKTKRGETKWVSHSWSPIFAEDKLQMVVSVVRDITERKKAEGTLRKSEEKYRFLYEKSPVTNMIIGIDGTIKDINDPFIMKLGYSKDEIIGKPALEFVVPEQREKVAAILESDFKGESTPEIDVNVYAKDGSIHTILFSSEHVILYEEDQPTSILITGIDITERKLAEGKLKEYTQKIEEKNLELKAKNQELIATRAQLVQQEKLHALGQMASGVAHNFNNLLAIILGRAQLLQRKAKELEIERGLRSIERAALDASSTIKRIQDFTRVRKDQEFQWVDIDKAIEDVIALTKTEWKDQAETNGISITLEVQNDRRKLPPVAGDESELKEVFTNVLLNAVEAIPKEGKIVIKVWTDRRSVFISFADSGTGIPEDVKQKIFDPFFTTKGVKNTGLGLSVAYGIIQRHQGDIQIESKQGEGTTVVVRLPVSQILEKKQVKEEKPDRPSLPPDSTKILVIEDEQAVRELFFDILTLANYTVKVTPDGSEGIELYKREKFDIVFTDLGMPKMSGWEVAKAIKEIDSSTPVFLITGWGVEMSEEKLKESGIDQVVCKPIKVETLLTLVSQVMEARKKAEKPVEGTVETSCKV
jgi:PAS domain S-box-containing protein